MKDEETLQSTNTTEVGRYQLARRIGRGGMGEVWLGEDPRLHRQVAIKTLPLRSQHDQDYLRRFEREARAAAALNHPHILPIHDYGEQALADGQSITYIVMPYVSGGTLAGRFETLSAEHRLMPPGEAMHYLSQAAQAIDYAHGQQVVHRDIKPANMLLRSDGWLLLADFGIARILSDQANLTQTGMGIGTPEYMAPEQAQGRPEAASDIYSLAVIAYQMFTGQLPFQADTPYAVTVQHIISPPPPPRQANPNLSVAVEQALLHGLAKEPARRPPSASAFVAELQNAWTDPAGADTIIGQGFPSTGEPVTLPSNPGIGPGGTVVAATPFPATPVPSQVPAAPPASTGITRRRLLIGGGAGAVLLAAGGLSAWGVASHQTTTKPRVVPTTKPVINPNAPVVTLLAHTQAISSLAWSPAAANMLASAGRDSQVMVWDIAAIAQGQASKTAPKAKQQFDSPPEDAVLLAWSGDGSAIAIANAHLTVEANGNSVDMKMLIYKNDLSGPEPYYNDQYMTFLRTPFASAISWGPGKYVTAITKPYELAGKTEWRLEFRDPLNPQLGFGTILEYGFGYSVVVSPADKSTLALGIWDGVLIGQPVVAGKTAQWKTAPATLTFDSNRMPASAVTWSPDGQYVAAIVHPIVVPKYSPSKLAVWNVASGDSSRLTLSLPSASTVLSDVAWCPAPSSKLLAAGSQDGGVYIWEVNPGNLQGNALPTRSLNGLVGAQVTALAWSPDGQWLAAGYNDTNDSVLIWKL